MAGNQLERGSFLGCGPAPGAISLWTYGVVALALSALLVPAGAAATASPPGTRIWMRNIVLFPFSDAPARVVRMSGTALPTRPGRIIDMNDVRSYAVRVRYAEMVMPAASMQVLMNRHILPQANTAIKQVSVTFGNGVVLMRGVLQKGVPIGFTAEAVASATPRGEMMLTVTKMKAAGFIPKGVMHALGLNLAKVAQPDNRQVFRIVGDTMIIPISSMFPPPKFYGPLRSVRVTPQGLIAVVGAGNFDIPPKVASGPLVHMAGGQVQFARLTMSPVDLTLVPKARAASLGFSPAQYYRQLIAGYSISEPDFGLTAHIADYRTLQQAL